MPSTYSVMDMGYADYGGGPKARARARPDHGGTSVTDLVADPDRAGRRHGRPRRPAGQDRAGVRTRDRRLHAERHHPRADDQRHRGRARRGATCATPPSRTGVSLHWHGLDVPNAEDGVAGVTQDAVDLGGTHTYRFVAEQVGTYWYHSHQVSHEQVIGGLFGSLVVLPQDGIDAGPGPRSRRHTPTGASARSTARRA